MDPVEAILDQARWAPSGDNTQPWRFARSDADHVAIHAFDTRDHCVYDLDGHASQLAVGCLLETLAIAATGHGRGIEVKRRPGSPDTQPVFDVHLQARPEVRPDPLLPSIPRRCVQRRPMSTAPIGDAAKAALEDAVAPAYRLLWLESWSERWRTARLMYANAQVRLTTPEAYAVHRAIIDWNSRYSEDKVPDQAIGLDPLTLKLMRWAMHSWQRVHFLNTYLLGTVAPRLQLDLLPGLACGAHVALLADRAADSVADYVAGGRAVQRLWLTATQHGLQLQPEMTPVIFSRYVRAGRGFTVAQRPARLAHRLAGELEGLVGREVVPRLVFFCRLGHGSPARARSLRLPLARLWHAGESL